MIATLSTSPTNKDKLVPWYLSGGGLDMAQYECKTWPNGARQHYWHWGDPAKPEAKEPAPDAKCQCGETTWAEEKIKQGVVA